MTWATPLLAGIAAAIAVPTLIILYFLKLRRRDVEVSSTLLWRKAIQDLQANAPFQRLRRNLLLFLQLLALAAVLLALAQPQMRGQTLSGQRHIILIDRSASMSATDGDEADPESGRTRLEEARARAIALVDSLRDPGLFMGGGADEAMVIAFSTTAEVRQQFTSDKNLLRQAIRGVEPTDAPSSLDEAMRLARAHAPRRRLTETIEDGGPETDMEIEGLFAGEGSTIHLFSDGALPDADEVLPANTDTVVYHAIGQADAANAGITSVRAQRDYEHPEELSVFVAVESTGRTERSVDVQLALNDSDVLGIQTVTLPAATRIVEEVRRSEFERAEAASNAATAADGGEAEGADEGPLVAERWEASSSGVVFRLTRAEAGLFSVRLLATPGSELSAPPDVLAVDDEAWLAVPPARQLAVAVVTEGNLFLRGLEGLPLASLETYTPAAWRALDEAARIAFDVVVLDRWLPDGGLPPGRFLVLGIVPTEGTGITDRGQAGEGTGGVILDWRRDHPVLRELVLDAIEMARPRLVDIAEDAPSRAIADGDFGPAIIEFSRDQTRALIVPFNPVASTWPFDVSWVVFLAAGVDYLGHDAGSGGGARQVQPGSVLADRVPLGATGVELVLPQGGTIGLEPASDGRVVYGPITRTGIYALRWTGQGSAGDVPSGSRMVRAYAANLGDERESEVSARLVLPLADQVAVASGETSRAGIRNYWPWLILAALGVMMFEWWVYNRKVYL
ncbi:MAG: VWA domain-containing protein [Phycisphaerales bacterium]